MAALVGRGSSAGGGARGAGRLVAALLGAAVVLGPSVAGAQESTGAGKGIAGGALLGGEVVVAVEAAAGVQAPWAYAVGGVLGAAGGGVGGFFVEQSMDAKVPLYMLAGGMALAIPSTILALNAISYKPPVDYQEDSGASVSEPAADPARAPAQATPRAPAPAPAAPAAGPSSEAPRRSVRPQRLTLRGPVAMPLVPPPSVFELSSTGMRLGVPAVAVLPVYSRREAAQFGVQQGEEVRIPVLGGVFLGRKGGGGPRRAGAR